MLSRLETMVLQGTAGLPLEAIRQQIASAVDIIIHLSRLRDKSRKTMEICEVVGYEPGKGNEMGRIILNPLYVFVEDENSTLEKVSGQLLRTENKMQNDFKLRLSGFNLNLDGSYLKNDIMFAKTDGKYKIYDKDGKRIGSFECDDIDVITDDGIIAFKTNDKWGFVDSTGKVVVEAKFDNAKSFSNGLAAICQSEKWGFADKDGTVVIDCQFFDADYFNSKRNCLVKSTPDDWQMIALKVKF